jgi:hypothetical protein
VRRFFQPNIDEHGRRVRARLGFLLLIAGGVTAWFFLWAGLVLIGSGLFAWFEARRGWCVARACGIKTKI